MAAIELINITKKYRLYTRPLDRLKEAFHPLRKRYYHDFMALDRINLTIDAGEKVGIIGRNGSGKSTLMKIIAGSAFPTEGDVKINGALSALLQLGAGFNSYYSGISNIFFYGMILGFSKMEMQERLDEIIEFSELDDFIHQPVRTYSSGMKSRLAFSIAANIDPDILILDEVLSVGDEFFKQKCYIKLNELWESGKTILFVSHSLRSVNTLCDRVVWLERGRIIDDGCPRDIIKQYRKLKKQSSPLLKNLKK